MTEKSSDVRDVGVYVHFPFCLAKCPYCDFVSYAAAADLVPRQAYADAVSREIDLRAEAFSRRHVRSVFFGGGTPSLWGATELGRVLARLREAGGPGAQDGELEVTVECNPSTLDEDRARALLDVGVNRLSVGVQSLREDGLRFLGRLHDVQGGLEAVRGAMRAGTPRVSADVIYGLPGQSPEDAREQVLKLADLGLTHLSCYQLTIEPGTRFGELARRGRLPLADEGQLAESFLAVDAALSERGLRHYEVSNFARPGEEARHNLGYWRGDEYVGLGCAAVGMLREDRPGDPARGVRYRNETRPARYIEGALGGAVGSFTDSEEALDAPSLLRERIMLGLRVDGGLDLDGAASDLGVPGWTPERERTAERLQARGRLVRERQRVRIPPPAWLWTDDTAARLF
jgi:oxygen-independent coproporphyrinogen-3 oxidase